MSNDDDVLTRFLGIHDVLVLDGGLATELEKRGWSLADPLWSANLLLENPAAIEAVHLDYLMAGADCVITASYQATFEGFAVRGLAEESASEVMRRSVALALNARERFWKQTGLQSDRAYPLIAASIGPYGAFLADGSEFHGRYGISRDELFAFHRRRMAVLVDAGADLLACETLPSLAEAEVVVDAMREFPRAAGWLGFTCASDRLVAHGEPIGKCAERFASEPRVLALGVNCTAPQHVAGLVQDIRANTRKPIVVYPNSGEEWDGTTRGWKGRSDIASFVERAMEWRAQGVAIMGGCCRTGPEHIAALAARLKRNQDPARAD